MSDGLVKRSLSLDGHRTSVALEPEFWAALTERAALDGVSMPALVARIDAGRGTRTLASALRVAALAHAREAGADGRNVRADGGA